VKHLAQIVLNGEGTVGGEQRHVLNVIDGLDSERFSVDVMTWDIPAFVEELQRRGVPTVPVTARRILDRALLRRLEADIRAGGYDLVHAHGHRAGLLGRLAAIRAGVPHVVWTCHVAENKADRNPLLRWGYRRALRYLDARTDATVAVSDFLRERLVSEGLDPAKIVVVPNGVDCSVFRPGPRSPALLGRLSLDDGAPVVGTVARLTEQKGVETLIDAAGRVARVSPRVQFLVVGAGPLEDRLRAQAARSGARVVFAGERSDMPEVVRAFDIAVVPSLWEGAFCYTVLEAMASRTPVICSDIRLFTDVVDPGTDALVFPAGDPAALSSDILSLLEHREDADRMAEAGMRMVREHFSVEQLRERMTGVYEGLFREERS
jgi:glycosyltransferase involved in cell wall biosynthesis